MEILKEKTMEIFNKLNQEWVDSIKDGEEKGEGLDLSRMFGKHSKLITDLDSCFREAKERMKKKKGFFR
ncbi:hypothetical protein A3K72_01880 [Candidatus Woesearchaeota archaeon RBG_13_36_6]|nr:MAG: hypothetical protein A3K72_01880 [Candidatus Woesearchaeota archaeon RBG_13_36_6]